MGKKSSIVWRHFTMSGEGTRATCHICKKELSYTLQTMSNLSRHIRIKHPELLSSNNPANDSSIEIYAIEDVEQEITAGGSKPYEIAMGGFEEMEDMNQPIQNDESVTEAENSWRDQPAPLASSTTEKKDRKRSKVWNHFKRSSCNKNATCLHCGRGIRLGTISNLARHLRHLHPGVPFIHTPDQTGTSLRTSYSVIKAGGSNESTEVSALKSEYDLGSEVIELHINDFQKPDTVIETRVNEIIGVVGRETDTGIITQSSQTESYNIGEDFDMHDYIKPKQTAIDSERADRLLIKMIVKGCHPVSMVEERGFKEFISALNPKYELPSLSKLTNELIPECYKECELRATKTLRETEGICLYLDQWKSKTDIYLCVTAHFINKECKFESLFLACHVLSADETVADISQRLLETVSEWDVSDKIVAVVTDNSEMAAQAVKLVDWVYIPHFIRSLSLVVHDSLNIIKSIVTKVKNITEELKKSPQVIAEIYSKHKSLGHSPVKLITKVKNGWYFSFTTLEMLLRFTKLKSALMFVLHHVPEYKLSESEWRVLQSYSEVFGVFKEVKQEVTKEERVCLSKLVFFIKSLKRIMSKVQTMNSMPSDVVFAATNTITLLENNFNDFMGNNLVSFMLLLDPRLKKYAFTDESEYASACSLLKKEVCEVSVPESEYNEPDPDSLWYSFDMEVIKLNGVKDPIGKGILEFENYLQEQILDRDQDPLVWWDKRKAIYPRLYKLVRKYLCITNKYTQRESISHKTAYMLSQLRNCESTASESELMFLHHNL